MAGVDDLFLPQLIRREGEEPAPWRNEEADIRESSVDLVDHVARVPRAHTEAQALARYHEAGHVKYSPEDITQSLTSIMLKANEMGLPPIDSVTALRIAKMLEESRVDALLWRNHEIDDRPARESLNWESMPFPTDPVAAVEMILQLAWTCFGGMGVRFPGSPPARKPDRGVQNYFNALWEHVHKHNPELGPAIVRACTRMYEDPTDEARDRAAAELASFFPIVVPEARTPPKKREQLQAEKEAAEEEAEAERNKRKEESGEEEKPELLLLGDDKAIYGTAEIHDHTVGIRRPSLRIARRDVPQFTGTRLVFPHRYMVDKAIFSRRVLTEGGIMVDASGSMSWSEADLRAVLALMPAVWVATYCGFSYDPMVSRPDKYTLEEAKRIIGRICILAKSGRFAKYGKKERGASAGNEVDLEALTLLAKWPRPRLWLSDGMVTGGAYMHAPPIDERWTGHPICPPAEAAIIDRANLLMKRNEIYRVATKEDMLKLLRRQRVTVYRSCASPDRAHAYPSFLQPQPVTFQL